MIEKNPNLSINTDGSIPQNNGTEVLPAWTAKVGNILRFLAKFMPNTIAKFMAKMWFKPYMPKQKQHVTDWQERADQEIQLSKGQAFLFSGDSNSSDQEKPLVLCIHGWRGRGHQMRRFLQPLLDRGFQVVMVNLPAHCDTDPNNTHIYECADVIKQLAQKVGPIDSVIAHSFGSPVTSLALNKDLKIRKLIFLAGNFNIRHLLIQYARAFELERLVPKIEAHLQKMCDELIFKGSWENLRMEVIMENLLNAEDVQFWQDPQDAEISIPTNLQIHQFLKERGQSTSIHEVADLGHFNILKSDEVVGRICEQLS